MPCFGASGWNMRVWVGVNIAQCVRDIFFFLFGEFSLFLMEYGLEQLLMLSPSSLGRSLGVLTVGVQM